MLLTDAQWTEAVGRLNTTIGADKCPLCGTEDMHVGQHVFELRPFAFGRMLTEGPILPVLPAECSKCGYTMFFNAVSLGIVPLDEDGEVASDDE